MTPSDAFCTAFDNVEIACAPSRAAIERAMEVCAPEPNASEPGFYLLDDCGGRFVVDRDFGMVSLKDASLLKRERGAIRAVRLRVIERSGASYQLSLNLRVTGLVPQMVGGEAEEISSPIAG